MTPPGTKLGILLAGGSTLTALLATLAWLLLPPAGPGASDRMSSVREKPALWTTNDELTRLYQADPAGADRRFKGKWLDVRGQAQFAESASGELGRELLPGRQPLLLMDRFPQHGRIDFEWGVAFYCEGDSGIRRIDNGVAGCTIRGICLGKVYDTVLLDHCRIIPVADPAPVVNLAGTITSQPPPGSSTR